MASADTMANCSDNHSLGNLVVTCAPCNDGRMQYTLEEAGLQCPLKRPPRQTGWTGLEQRMGARPLV